MLGSFRKASQSWPAKIFFGLLTLSFVGWGVGDVLRSRFSNQPAITVGEQKIDATTVVDEFRRDADRLQRQTGGKISIDQLRQMGLLNQTIQRLVTDALMDQEGERLGLAVDDNTVRTTIAGIPAFRNQLGAFDANLYHQALQANGFTEIRFESLTRRDIQRREVSDIVALGTTVPTAMAEPIFRYRNEKRVVELIAFVATAMAKPAPPDQAVLEAYHKDHATQFTAPERRALTVVVLRAADLVADFKPTDEQIAKAYQDRQADFTTEETRHLQQVFFSDKESAQTLVDAIKSGKSLADAAKAAGKSVDDLGEVQPKSLPIESLATAAFAAEVPGVAGPVQTPLGWNVLYVTDKKPGAVKPLAEVKASLVADLTKAEAMTRMNGASTKLEDAIGSGATLDEVATQFNTKPIKIAAMDASGMGDDGKPIAGIPQGPAFRTAAFGAAKGSVSDVIPLENEEGYAVLRVDDVMTPALRPFDSVKDAVAAAWTLEQQVASANAAAKEAALRLGKGESAAKVADKIKVETTEPFTREGGKTVPAPVAAAAFKLEAGQAVSVPVGETVFAVHLSKVIPADPKADALEFEALKADLQKSIAGDMTQQYLTALQQEIGVSIKPAIIERQFSQSQ